jgi:hypothetical protein
VVGEGSFDFRLYLDVNGIFGDMVKVEGSATGKTSLQLTGDGVKATNVSGALLTVYTWGDTVDENTYTVANDLDEVLIAGTPGDDIEGLELVAVVEPESEPPTLTLSQTSLPLDYKASATLTANESVTWKSDNKAVTVDDSGKVISVRSFIKTPKASITATSIDGERTATCEVTVKPTWQQWLMIILLFGWIWM